MAAVEIRQIKGMTKIGQPIQYLLSVDGKAVVSLSNKFCRITNKFKGHALERNANENIF